MKSCFGKVAIFFFQIFLRYKNNLSVINTNEIINWVISLFLRDFFEKKCYILRT